MATGVSLRGPCSQLLARPRHSLLPHWKRPCWTPWPATGGDCKQAVPLFKIDNLSLQASAAPPLTLGFRSPVIKGRTTHQSCMPSRRLSRIPLLLTVTPPYLSLARLWLSAVYGWSCCRDLRYCLHNQQIEARPVGDAAKSLFRRHELKKLIDEGLETLQREMERHGHACSRQNALSPFLDSRGRKPRIMPHQCRLVREGGCSGKGERRVPGAPFGGCSGIIMLPALRPPRTGTM